jgi:UDP-glucose 4-epimerase
MILVIGGLNGFIGSNTTEALVNLSRGCVVTRHENTEVPGFLQTHVDQGHVFIEPADATSIADLRKIGAKHKIDGIVNVAGGFASGDGPLRGLQGYMAMLIAVFKVAQEWKVKRVTFSSTIGMYFGLQGTVNEEQPIILPSPFPILGYQKIVEVASGEFSRKTGISSICVRLSGMYGPNQDPTQYSLPQRLVNAAVCGKPPNLENVFLSNADDEEDLIYIKDMARAIALLQTAEKLQYNVYNIGTGKMTPNRDLVETIMKVVPNFDVNLQAGRGPFAIPFLETKRLQEDTGFSPKFDIQSAVEDYVDWLKAGNPK